MVDQLPMMAWQIVPGYRTRADLCHNKD